MAYTKTNWTSTTPININNLQKIENGIKQNNNAIDDLNNVIDEVKDDINEINNDINKVENDINELNNKHIYSTEEQVIGVWTDGKTLYRRFLIGTKNSGWTDISIPEIDYDTIYINNALTNFDYTSNSATWSKGQYYFSSTDYITAQIKKSGNQINIGAGTSLSDISYRVVIEYTKTTD